MTLPQSRFAFLPSHGKCHDIAIIGSGMVGATLAVALADLPLRIALIDAAPMAAATDHRLIALTHVSCTLYARLGLWPALREEAAPINSIHVSEKGRFGITRLHAADAGVETLGHVVPAAAINTALESALAGRDNITRLHPARVVGLLQSDNQVSLDLAIPHANISVTANIVIAADGTQSGIRKLLDIPVETVPGEQSALVTVTHLQRDLEGVAYERFLKTGALAMLPLKGQRAATIWTDRTDTIKQLLAEPDDVFIKHLQAALGYRAGRLIGCEARYSYPLVWMWVKPEHQQKGQVLLIGNAAHTLHPVAAQGLNLALQEVECLFRHFAARGQTPLALPTEADYFQTQKISYGLSRQLTRLFTADFLPLNILRQMGLLALDLSGFARSRFLRLTLPSQRNSIDRQGLP